MPTLQATAAEIARSQERLRLAKHLFKSERVCRQVWIDGQNRRPDRIHDLRGGSLGPNQHGKFMHATLGHREKDLLGIASIQQNSPCVAGHADHLIARPIKSNFALDCELPARRQTQGAANRVLFRPQQFCSRFAKNDAGFRLAGLCLESAPEQQRNAQRLKIVRLNIRVIEDRSRILWGGFFSIQRNRRCS
jgi:hypothetical protein